MLRVACPLLLPHDKLSLHTDTIVERGQLYDRVIGARHAVAPAAHALLLMLDTGCTYQRLGTLAVQQQVSRQQVADMLGFLSSIGALQVQRRVQDQPLAAMHWVRALLLGVVYPGRMWRRRSTLTAIAQGIGRSIWPIAGVAGISGSLLVTAHFYRVGEVLIGGFWMLGLFTSSLIVHEYAHHRMIRRRVPVIILQQGMRIGLVHRPLVRREEWRSALIGPMAGTGSCCVVALLCLAAGAYHLGALSGIIGSFHAGSLLPWYADGMILWRRETPRHA